MSRKKELTASIKHAALITSTSPTHVCIHTTPPPPQQDTVRRCSRNVYFQPSLVLRPFLAPVLYSLASSMPNEKERPGRFSHVQGHPVDRHGRGGGGGGIAQSL